MLDEPFSRPISTPRMREKCNTAEWRIPGAKMFQPHANAGSATAPHLLPSDVHSFNHAHAREVRLLVNKWNKVISTSRMREKCDACCIRVEFTLFQPRAIAGNATQPKMSKICGHFLTFQPHARVKCDGTQIQDTICFRDR
jgi:hypothetical protein